MNRHDGGRQLYDGEGFFDLTQEDGLMNNQIVAMAEDSAGDLWFGGFTGMSRYSQGFSNITFEDGLANDDLRAVIQDNR